MHEIFFNQNIKPPNHPPFDLKASILSTSIKAYPVNFTNKLQEGDKR